MATAKPLNRSLPNFAYMIRHGYLHISSQSLKGVSCPHMHKIVQTRLLFITFYVGTCGYPQPKAPDRFLRTIRDATRFRAGLPFQS